MPKLGLDRQQLARFFQNNAEAIRAFEKVFDSVESTPASIEEVAAIAGTAAALGNLALSLISGVSALVEQLGTAPAEVPAPAVDDFAPALALGTLAQQNADSVTITGGAIDGTPIGAAAASTGAFTSISASGQITSTLASGTAPLAVTSTTKVANLNVDLLDGTDWTAPGAIGGVTPGPASFTTVSASGQITSTVATGTPPFVVASFTNVPGLNSSLLLGFNWVSPGAIGATTPSTGKFTSVTVAGGAQFLTTSTALTNGAGAGAGTIANAPAAGNPTKWIGINDNGTIRYIPAW